MTVKQLEKLAEKNGNKIAIGNAMEWSKSSEKVKQFYSETKIPKRVYAYSTFSKGYNCWVEPTRFFTNLKEVKEDLEENGII